MACVGFLIGLPNVDLANAQVTTAGEAHKLSLLPAGIRQRETGSVLPDGCWVCRKTLMSKPAIWSYGCLLFSRKPTGSSSMPRRFSIVPQMPRGKNSANKTATSPKPIR